MRPLINTKYNYDHTRYGEINDEPSMTIPGDTMSLRDMLDRFARGMALPPRPEPYYNEQQQLPNLNSMDLVDRQDYLQNQKELVDLLRQQYEDENKKPDSNPSAPPAPDSSATTPPTPNPSPDAK